MSRETAIGYYDPNPTQPSLATQRPFTVKQTNQTEFTPPPKHEFWKQLCPRDLGYTCPLASIKLLNASNSIVFAKLGNAPRLCEHNPSDLRLIRTSHDSMSTQERLYFIHIFCHSLVAWIECERIVCLKGLEGAGDCQKDVFGCKNEQLFAPQLTKGFSEADCRFTLLSGTGTVALSILSSAMFRRWKLRCAKRGFGISIFNLESRK